MVFFLKQNNHSTEICDYSTFLWWEIEQYLFCSCNTTLHVWSRDVPGCQCSNITFGKQFVYPNLSAMVLGNSPSSAVTSCCTPGLCAWIPLWSFHPCSPSSTDCRTAAGSACVYHTVQFEPDLETGDSSCIKACLKQKNCIYCKDGKNWSHCSTIKDKRHLETSAAKLFQGRCFLKRKNTAYGIVTWLLDRNSTAVNHWEQRQKC